MKNWILIAGLLSSLFASSFVQGKAKAKNPPPHIEREIIKRQEAQASAQDRELVEAVQNQRRVNFVAASGLLVIQLLADDTKGREHQKWIVQLSNGKRIQAVYNSDICPRVPLREGDIIDMAGEFIWTGQGGLLHWLHHDPHGNRPDGYVILDGTSYCAN